MFQPYTLTSLSSAITSTELHKDRNPWPNVSDGKPNNQRDPQTYWPDTGKKYITADLRGQQHPDPGLGTSRNCLLEERNFVPDPAYSDRLLRAQRAGLLVSLGDQPGFVAAPRSYPQQGSLDPRDHTRNHPDPMDIQDSAPRPPTIPVKDTRRQETPNAPKSRDLEMKDVRPFPEQNNRNLPDSRSLPERYGSNVTESRSMLENLNLQTSGARGYAEYERPRGQASADVRSMPLGEPRRPVDDQIKRVDDGHHRGDDGHRQGQNILEQRKPRNQINHCSGLKIPEKMYR